MALIGKPAERPLIGAISQGQPGAQDFAISALVSIEGKKGAQAQLAEALKSSAGEAAVKIKAVLGLLKSQAPDEGQDETRELVRLLREAQSAQEMDELTNSLVGRQYAFWYSLADILRSSAPPEKKARVCFLLGEFGAYRTLSWMIENISLKVENRGELEKIPLWRQYPCQEAIARIGKPAERALIQLLVDTDKDDVQELVVQAFIYIEGRDGAEFTLRRAIIEAPQGKAEKLEKALERLKK